MKTTQPLFRRAGVQQRLNLKPKPHVLPIQALAHRRFSTRAQLALTDCCTTVSEILHMVALHAVSTLMVGAPGRYKIEELPTGTNTVAITQDLNLIAGDYTVLAVGGANNQDLSLLPLSDNNTAPAAGKVFKTRNGCRNYKKNLQYTYEF